jgi:hypothetical protein
MDGSEALSAGGGAPWAATALPEFRSRRYRARRLGFSSSNWSGGQGDAYPGVLDDGLGSQTARGGGGFCPPPRLGS